MRAPETGDFDADGDLGIANVSARHTLSAAGVPTAADSRYCLYNHRGDVVAVLEDDNEAIYRYGYDACGNRTENYSRATGEGPGDAPTDDIRMAEKDLDEDTGLHSFDVKWYGPTIRRFVNQGTSLMIQLTFPRS